MVYTCSFSLVLCVAVHLEQCLDLIQKRLLSSIVGCSELLASLEHKVLEVVGESGCLGRVVLTSDLYCNVGLDARGLLVYTHIHLQSVVKGVHLCTQRVVCHSLILVL